MFSLRHAVLIVVLAAAAWSAVPRNDSYAQDTIHRVKPESSDWDNFVDTFLNDYFTYNPTVGVWAGKHEFDGLLPDWTRTGMVRYMDWLRSMRNKVKHLIKVEDLSEEQLFEREHVLHALEEELYEYDTRRSPNTNPLFYTNDLSPDVYATREYAPLSVRLKAYTRYATAVPTALARMKHNLETPLPRTYVETAIRVLEGLATYFEDDIPQIFAEVKDADLQAAFDSANQEAIASLRKSVSWLKEELEVATDAYALGENSFLEMLLRKEGVSIGLEELKLAGEQDLERNLGALESACGEFAPGSSLEDCVSKAQASKPSGGAVEGAQDQLDGLKKFLLEKDLVTIPGTEEARVDEAPPYARWNFAYIDIPGPYETGLPSTYYIAPADPSWSEEDRLAYVPGRASLLFVSVHEVWPGHFLHFLHANRTRSRFAQIFTGYAYSEGWAHYTEEMMWDAGLGEGDPETHIGQLLNALLRNVRYLSAIGLHAEGMTVAQSEQMFREKAFQDPGNARQQAVRGTFDAGYLNYTLGKLMIMKLRDDWCASRGGREAWKEFHDTFLSYGGPPIPLVRKDMMGGSAVGGAILPSH